MKPRPKADATKIEAFIQGGADPDDKPPKKPTKTPRPKPSAVRSNTGRVKNSRPPSAGLVRTSIDLPEDFHTALKIECVRRRVTMKDFILEALRDSLEN